MTAANHTITAEQGATYAQIFTCEDSAGQAVDLTGWTARMHVRSAYNSDTTLLALTTENGGITLGGAAGTVSVLATAAEMAAIDVPDVPGVPPVRSCVYDLELINGSVIERLLNGKFQVVREVTR